MKCVLFLLMACGACELVGQARARRDLDADGASLISNLKPIEAQSLRTILRTLSLEEPGPVQDVGFGGRYFYVRKGLNYSAFHAEGFEFRGRLGWLRIGIDVDGTRWPKVREVVLQAWAEAGGPDLTCSDESCLYEATFGAVMASHRKAVRGNLGRMSAATPNEDLLQHYELLISPLTVSYVGYGCGLPPQYFAERKAVDALVAANRIDLLTNVLRGYSVSGRIYALWALQELRWNGIQLPARTLQAMRVVRQLPMRVYVCTGCIVNGGLTARQVLAHFRPER